MFKIKVFLFVFSILMCCYQEIAGDCCAGHYFKVKHVCDTRFNMNDLICTSNICYDGTDHTSAYCGVGPCNMFGCGCTCRTGSLESAKENYKARNPYIRYVD